MRLTCAALLFVLVVALGVIVRSGRTLAFDTRVHHAVRGDVPARYEDEEDDTSFRTRFMHLGPDIGTATILVAPLTVLALRYLRHRRTAVLVGAATVGAALVTLFLKGVFQRTRGVSGCCRGYGHVFGYLFPSTHTVITIVTYGLLAYLIGTRLHGWRRVIPAAIVIIAVGFVGYSLVYLDTHYATDVLGGLFLGSAIAIIATLALRVTGRSMSVSDDATWAKDGVFPPVRHE